MNPILIVVPTAGELAHLTSALAMQGVTIELSTHGRLATAHLTSLNAVVATGGLGKTQFAVQTQHLLDVREWRFVVCAGAAGALSDDLSLGDVVIASETIEHDIRKVGRALMPRFLLDEALLMRCHAEDFADVRVHIGPIASGDEDIVDHERRAALRESTGALAVACGRRGRCSCLSVQWCAVRRGPGYHRCREHGRPTRLRCIPRTCDAERGDGRGTAGVVLNKDVPRW